MDERFKSPPWKGGTGVTLSRVRISLSPPVNDALVLNWQDLNFIRCYNNSMKKSYYIDYPQEHVEGQAHSYRCAFCKVITTKINGNLDGHLPICEYRLKLEHNGFECNEHSISLNISNADSSD